MTYDGTAKASHANRYPQLLDAEWLRDQYEVQCKSMNQIAGEIGCTSQNVLYRLQQAGISSRSRGSRGALPARSCERCGAEYVPAGPAQRFCSGACLVGIRACEFCGAEFTPSPPKPGRHKRYVQRYCSAECRAEVKGRRQYAPRTCEECGCEFPPRPPQEHNGVKYPQKFCTFTCRKAYWDHTAVRRYVNKKTGYVIVAVQDPNGDAGRVPEHKWVMERHLGRELRPGEEVHHKNTIKSDNDLANLELWRTSQPKGGRVLERIEWMLAYLGDYGEVTFAPDETIARLAE